MKRLQLFFATMFFNILNNETPSNRHWDKIEPDSVPVNEPYQVSSLLKTLCPELKFDWILF